MGLLRLWWAGVRKPVTAFDLLGTWAAPAWGLAAVFIRYTITAVLYCLPMYLMGRHPFLPSRLTFLPSDERYFLAETFFLPFVGLAIFLLGTAVAYVAIRLTGRRVDYDQIVNIGGLAAIVTVPFVLIWDWVMVLAGGWNVVVAAFSHSGFLLWGAGLVGTGYRRILGLPAAGAYALALGVAILSGPVLAGLVAR